MSIYLVVAVLSARFGSPNEQQDRTSASEISARHRADESGASHLCQSRSLSLPRRRVTLRRNQGVCGRHPEDDRCCRAGRWHPRGAPDRASPRRAVDVSGLIRPPDASCRHPPAVSAFRPPPDRQWVAGVVHGKCQACPHSFTGLVDSALIHCLKPAHSRAAPVTPSNQRRRRCKSATACLLSESCCFVTLAPSTSAHSSRTLSVAWPPAWHLQN